MSGIPISYNPFNTVTGFALAAPGGTATATVTAGNCFDTTVTTQLSTAVTTTITASAAGLNGIDTGTIAASTWYAVWVIGDSRRIQPTGFVASLSYTTPTLPFGYDSYRRIGYLLTDSSSHFLLFYQSFTDTTGGARQYLWDTTIRVLNGGSSATIVAVNLETAMPLASIPVILNADLVPNAASDKAYLQVYGSTASIGVTNTVVLSGVVAAANQYFSGIIIPAVVNTTHTSVQYAVTASGALTLYVAGFYDSL